MGGPNDGQWLEVADHLREFRVPVQQPVSYDLYSGSPSPFLKSVEYPIRRFVGADGGIRYAIDYLKGRLARTL